MKHFRRYNSGVKLREPKLPLTEQRNPRSLGLDRKKTLDILRIINREDASVARAVEHELRAIARAADAIARAFRRGGRLFYVGAGSSGRMGALDASECPPTFGVAKTRVQAIIAGGRRALTDAVEGAEDSAVNGANEISARRVGATDVVVGIAAAGTTPFVIGALREARRRSAFTVALTANRGTPVAKIVHVTIAVKTGTEVITGSTRMKAGTAQKMVLNMLSTAAMVRAGRVYDNLMIDVAMTNEKLRRRGLRILQQASGMTASTVEHAMRQSGHNLKTALVMLNSDTTRQEARRRLIAAHGDLRKALVGTDRRKRSKK
jgi:N-acetylmuramic acid 6-phosphate etherase